MPIPSKKVRNDLFNDLKKTPSAFLKNNESSSLLDFLSMIWELRTMPSKDKKFDDAYSDIFQHMVNNDDWDYDFLFLSYLKLLDVSDEMFKKFLEAIVSPNFRSNEDEIFRFVLLINDHIDKEQILLGIEDYDDLGLPIHSLKPKSDFEHSPSDLKKNSIPFYVQKKILGKANSTASHSKPAKLPGFVLAFNDLWNDYSKKTSFHLYYYDEKGNDTSVGALKIIIEESDKVLDMENSILEILPTKFTGLPESYCTLGTSKFYYQTLREILKRDFESVLYALRDVAFFPENKDRFEANPLLKGSLFREEKDERLSRQIRYVIYGYDLSNLYKFKYFFKPPYSDGSVDVSLDFNPEGDLPSRIIALIGKNGTGKTQLISSLPLHISKKEDKLFSPRAPLFSKVIAVSYSIFDRFEIPRRSSAFNYVYCGLRNENGEIMTERGQTQRFHNTWKKIQLMGRIKQWREFLLLFIDKSIVDEMIVLKEGEFDEFVSEGYTVSTTGVSSARKKLSSGQNILLNQVSEIVANIMYDSLILFDEPETHLHPNAVSQLINTIYDLVTKYQSFCVIATHSPIVIRELFSKNVLIIERHGNVPSVRRVGMESFGENLSVLTEEVFGNREIPKHYKAVIENLVSRGMSFDDIVSTLETTGSPLSLNARIYLRSLVA